MDLQNNPSKPDQGLSLPQPASGGAATMPLPTHDGSYAQSSLARPAVPVQAPPLAVTASPLTVLAPTMPAPVLRPTVPILPTNLSATSVQSIDATESIHASNVVSSNVDEAVEAADSDVIESEWVFRAKQVVATTKFDPFRQAQEMNKLKAEYMKKRYNKDIKLPGA
jgi:hypothetical protein